MFYESVMDLTGLRRSSGSPACFHSLYVVALYVIYGGLPDRGAIESSLGFVHTHFNKLPGAEQLKRPP